MVILHWERLAAGRWRLVDDEQTAWALIEPALDERTGEPVKPAGRGIYASGAFKVTLPRRDYPQSTLDPLYWCLASTILKAKHHAVAALRRTSWDDFNVDSDEPAYVPTLAGLRAILRDLHDARRSAS